MPPPVPGRRRFSSGCARGKLPGRVHVVDRGSRRQPRQSHVGDAEFLDAWLRHPRFRMIE
ncbi:DUF6368 family protein [Nocardia sp. IFM 10818]